MVNNKIIIAIKIFAINILKHTEIPLVGSSSTSGKKEGRKEGKASSGYRTPVFMDSNQVR